jgi:hypothetical protein
MLYLPHKLIKLRQNSQDYVDKLFYVEYISYFGKKHKITQTYYEFIQFLPPNIVAIFAKA